VIGSTLGGRANFLKTVTETNEIPRIANLPLWSGVGLGPWHFLGVDSSVTFLPVRTSRGYLAPMAVHRSRFRMLRSEKR